MSVRICAACFGAAIIAVTGLGVPEVEAQPRKPSVTTTTRAAPSSRPRARVTVAPRSFLDAGTEVLPGERKFMDYALPPGYQHQTQQLHMCWRKGVSPGPYQLRFSELGTVDPMISTVSFSPAPTVAPGSSVSVEFHAPAHANENYIPFVSCTFGSTPTGTGFDLPIAYDVCMDFFLNDPLSPFVFALSPFPSPFGALDGNGEATGTISIASNVPPGINLPLLVCFLTFNGPTVNGVSQVGVVVVN